MHNRRAMLIMVLFLSFFISGEISASYQLIWEKEYATHLCLALTADPAGNIGVFGMHPGWGDWRLMLLNPEGEVILGFNRGKGSDPMMRRSFLFQEAFCINR